MEYPIVRDVPSDRCWAFFWAALFFCLINLGVWFAFRFTDTKPFLRLQLTPSYEEIASMVQRIKRDPRPKIVFLGTSVVAGATVRDPQNAVPAIYADLLRRETGRDVVVYNMGISGARPLDAFLVALLLRDSATLLIIDNNRWNSAIVSRQSLLSGMSAYVRISQLYRDHAMELYREIPAMKQCFADHDVPLIDNLSFSEAGALSRVSAVVPLLKDKDLINVALFGQHPIGVAEEALLALHSPRGWKDLSMLFSPVEEKIEDVPWNFSDTSQASYGTEPEFLPGDINNCFIRAFAQYAASVHLSVVDYISPNNPGILHQNRNDMHRRNNAMIMKLFEGTRILDLDDGSLPAGMFTDLQHFTTTGSYLFATTLFAATQGDLIHAGLLR